MAVRVLGIDIVSYLKGEGFKAVDKQIDGLKSSLASLKSFANNNLVKMAAGYFTVNTLMSQYNKAIEASNIQIENETKLYANLKAQNYRDEQIESLKNYASELQSVGVIGDEASLASIRQLASFKLQEKSIKELLPSVHNLMVAEKGLNSTSADGEKWSKSLGIAVSTGQVRALRTAGVVLDEHTAKLFENASEQERVAILTKELKERIGEQNAEYLKTPEGKIVSAQNRIGDVYEYIGGLVRNERAEFWELIADNAEWIQKFLGGIVKAGAGAVNTLTRTIGGVFNLFKAMPPEARTTIKLLTGFLMLKKFPIAGAFLVIEDIFAAFQGKESFTEDAINALFEFFNTDYKFEDLRKGIADFWDLLVNKSDKGIEKINLTTKVLADLLDLLKGGAGLLQMLWGATGGLIIDTGRILTGDFENVGKSSFGNISKGWDKLHGAGLHMNETSAMYDNFLYDETLKKQQEEINKIHSNAEYIRKYQGSSSVPLATNNLSSLNEKYFMPRLPDKNTAKETMKQKIEKTEVKNENKKFEYINKATYEININGAGENDKETARLVENILRRHDEENLQKMKVMIGGNYSLAGGY